MVFPLTDWTRPITVGTTIVISVAATGDVAVFDVPWEPRTCSTSPTVMAANETCLPSRLYFVDELVVTVTVPLSVRSVSVPPLIFVTVPVPPPQKPPPRIRSRTGTRTHRARRTVDATTAIRSARDWSQWCSPA